MSRYPTSALLGTALAIYAPFVFLGYGAIADSIRIAETGRSFMATGVYIPSRYPGFPVHEIPAAVLAHVGGSVLSNAGSAAMGVLGAYAFIRILANYAVPHRTLLTLALIANPMYWTAATFTIDYVWSLSLLLVGFALMRHGRYFWSAVVLGLATGSRATSAAFAAVLVVYQFVTQKPDRGRLVRSAPLIVFIAALAYVPTLRRYGVLRLYFGDWDTFDYVANFFYGTLLFVGPQAAFALLVILPPLAWRQTSPLSMEWKRLAWLCLVIVGGFAMLFLIAPLQVGYLLPALPCVLILLGIALRQHRRALAVWVSLSISSALLTVNLVSLTGGVRRPESALPPLVAWHGPSVSGRATTVTVGVFVRWGYVVSDAVARAEVMSAGTRRE